MPSGTTVLIGTGKALEIGNIAVEHTFDGEIAGRLGERDRTIDCSFHLAGAARPVQSYVIVADTNCETERDWLRRFTEPVHVVDEMIVAVRQRPNLIAHHGFCAVVHVLDKTPEGLDPVALQQAYESAVRVRACGDLRVHVAGDHCPGDGCSAP